MLFDAPSRALACAMALGERMRELGLRVRAGLHAGECELLAGDDVGGIAVHIAARIAALAGPDEVLASATVRDLSVGCAFALESRGERLLKGLDEPWRLYAVAAGAGEGRGERAATCGIDAVCALPWPQASNGRDRWGPYSQPGSALP